MPASLASLPQLCSPPPLPSPSRPAPAHRPTPTRACPVGPFSGAVGTGVFQQQASCLLPSPEGTLPEPKVVAYQWDNGEQSTITFTVTPVTRATVSRSAPVDVLPESEPLPVG
jgi:hypothetical protein